MTENLNPTNVENYLIKNPEFLKSYLSKHGAPDITHKDGSHSEPSSPEIKIKRLPNFTSGRGNSITTSIFKKYVEGNLERIKKTSKDRNQLLSMSEDEVFMELIRDIATELDVNVLCHKILKNVSILTRSDRGSLFLVRGSKGNRYLVSKLFDVTEVSTISESLHTEETEIKVPFGKGIAGFVAESKDTVNIKDAYEVKFIYNTINSFWVHVQKCIFIIQLYETSAKHFNFVLIRSNLLNFLYIVHVYERSSV